MSVSPYVLNNLYNQGILDYVPYDLCNGNVNVSAMTGMQNPYLSSAMQGDLYQQSGMQQDSFKYSGTPSNSIGAGVNNGANVFGVTDIGSQSNAGWGSKWGFGNIGSNSSAAKNSLGLNGIGTESSAGLNSMGLEGIGARSNVGGLNAWGGINDASKTISNGVKGSLSFFERIPTTILGVVSGGLIVGSLAMFMKRGKKVAVEKTALSKLNPINWFKKK